MTSLGCPLLPRTPHTDENAVLRCCSTLDSDGSGTIDAKDILAKGLTKGLPKGRHGTV